ncbi:hypothetical protein FSP39_015299 [Pinctada imbricata]|uniref:Autocrine proliferation repressor protein A n=1 Tax=Pinctada imbricata TaxID=66713 RepID=A0AA88XV27_PINIB|nr:hypothetical protein FSP39_015299 [Pinctada imbricata]
MKPVALPTQLCLLSLIGWSPVRPTPLDDYVNAPDPHYSYTEIASSRGPGYTLYTLNLTSQKWLDELISNRPIWWHYLTVTIPDKINYTDSASMFIDGGSNDDGPPSVTDNFVALTTVLAASTGAISADLKMIPNQPITFRDDPSKSKRSEDAIIAWTWKKFVQRNGSNPEILLRMPMTKAAVRAMDTIADFAKKKLGSQVNIDKFFIAGASKRGWTTWTTGAVDKRVFAMVPIVLDLLNIVKNLHHMYRNLGGWTFAFNDYYDCDITRDLDKPAIQKMADIVDPFAYNDRYETIPKLMVTTGGDEFFQPDDANYYFSDLKGPKYLRQVIFVKLPNAEHSCAGHEISLLFSLRSFFLQTVTQTPFPKFSWKREFTSTGGRITLYSESTPFKVQTYYARTLDSRRRDFRLLIANPDGSGSPFPHPVFWLSDAALNVGNNTYIAEYQNPNGGWLAFFIQVAYPGVGESVLEFTTEALIIPDTFPFPDCQGEGCKGTLV